VVELTRQLHQQLKPELQPTALGTLGCISSNWTLPSPNTTPFPLDLHPLLREARTKGSQLVVLEASSHALHQERLAHLNISASAIVHLGHDHLDYHKTLNAYHEAKLKLIQMTQGPVVVNIDVLEQYPERFKGCEIITTGINRKADISFEIKEQNEHGFHGQLRLHGHSFTTSLPLWGTFNLSNSLAASAFASISGCDAEAIAEAWPTLQLPKGRLHAVETRAKGDVRIDYAHTPDALESVLLAAKAHCPTARLNVLVGCGGDRDASKRPLMGEIASKLADQLIITSDNPRSESPEGIIQDILLGCGDTKPMVEVDRRKAITKALEAQGENDLLLICGKGHENEQIISDQRHHFDEFEICQKF
jgi:UDP-N-acetylmuramoyl-L-alanyl-D-glutamate--2,6-diaminopimelate ligase